MAMSTEDHPFRCQECGHKLHWDDLDPDSLLVCAHIQCSAAGMTVPVWKAQQRREDLDEDDLAPAAGLPRPVSAGLPIPYVTPVSNGRPWWRLTHGARLLACQHSWLCQFCGLPLPELAWVVLNGDHIESDAALHKACLDLALSLCPHLNAESLDRHCREVPRSAVLADGTPLSTSPPEWRQQWTLSPGQPKR